MNFTKNRAFTLIELLTVIAIIGILAGIIIPTVGAVKVAAKKAQTKAQFSQWTSSIVLFKQEYGYFPAIATSGNKLDPDIFAPALTGKKLDGSSITAAAELYGNKKKIPFYSISDKDLSEDKKSLVDAFGNTDIAVYCDKNGDGIITTADGGAMPTVKGIEATSAVTPAPKLKIETDAGPRASVVFYSAGQGDDASKIIYSWE